MAHDIRALPASTSSAPDPAGGPPPAPDPHRTCRHCGRSLTSSDQATWHTTTGTVSCRPVLDELDGGWCEPDPMGGPTADPAPLTSLVPGVRPNLTPHGARELAASWTAFADELARHPDPELRGIGRGMLTCAALLAQAVDPAPVTSRLGGAA